MGVQILEYIKIEIQECSNVEISTFVYALVKGLIDNCKIFTFIKLHKYIQPNT